MNNTEFKKAFDDVSPDMYMQTRILANIKDKKKKKHFPLKPVIGGVTALVLAAVVFTAVNNKQPEYVDRPFSVLAVEASDDIVISKEIEENAISLPNSMRLTNEKRDGEVVSSEMDTGFYVDGYDIDYVQYSSENGSFYYTDFMKMICDLENDEYYSAVIDVSDEDAKTVNSWINEHRSALNVDRAAFKEYIKTHDVSEYFKGKSDDPEDYFVEFNKCSEIVGYEDHDGYAFFLISIEKNDSYYDGSGTNYDFKGELTLKRYDVSEETFKKYYPDEDFIALSSPVYSPDQAISVLLNNPDMDKSELPGDEITIIVTFKDGKKAKKVVTVAFDSDGYAQFAYKN